MKAAFLKNINTCPSKQRLYPVCRCFSTATIFKNSTLDKGIFRFSQTEPKGYIKVLGPDAPKFLNGLVMSKLLPHYTKKNLTTINPNDKPEQENLPEFDYTRGNWGAYVDYSDNGPYITRFGVYTGLLNSKGKLISDTIIYTTPLIGSDNPKVNKYPSYLLEFNESMISVMNDNFNIHKLASKVKIKELGHSSLKSWDIEMQLPGVPKDAPNPWIMNILEPCTLNKTPESALDYARSVVSSLFYSNEHKIEGLHIERRNELELEVDGSLPQKFRVITKGDVDDISTLFNPLGLPFEFQIEKKDRQFFRRKRFESGYIDGATDVKPETLLPLELNFGYIPNAVSADKGCYVGQELTARTFATGILRKRLVPVTLTNLDGIKNLIGEKYPEVKMRNGILNKASEQSNNANSPFSNNSSTPTKPRRQIPAGSLIAHEGNKGVALLRLEHFDEAFGDTDKHDLFYIQNKENKNSSSEHCIGVIPHRPSWLDLEETD